MFHYLFVSVVNDDVSADASPAVQVVQVQSGAAAAARMVSPDVPAVVVTTVPVSQPSPVS